MGMSDQLAQQGATSDEPSAQPVGQADLDKWKQELTTTLSGEFDKRFQGFQKIISERDRKIDDLTSMLEELKTADLSDDERVQLEREALEQEKAAIAAERELLSIQQEFPDEVTLYRQVLEKDSAKDQIALLRQWKESLTQQPAPEPDPNENGDDSQNQSAIDPNNPAATTTDGMDYQTQFEKDPSLVDKILRGAKRLSAE
jgi:hypothetical protein